MKIISLNFVPTQLINLLFLPERLMQHHWIKKKPLEKSFLLSVSTCFPPQNNPRAQAASDYTITPGVCIVATVTVIDWLSEKSSIFSASKWKKKRAASCSELSWTNCSRCFTKTLLHGRSVLLLHLFSLDRYPFPFLYNGIKTVRKIKKKPLNPTYRSSPK